MTTQTKRVRDLSFRCRVQTVESKARRRFNWAMIQDRAKSLAQNICMFCGQAATEFRDNLSRREYKVSGICQECQDKTFGT